MPATTDFTSLLKLRLDRRAFVGGATLGVALAASPGIAASRAAGPAFAFGEIAHGVDDRHHVAPGHTAQVLLRWGDPVLPGAPSFDPAAQTAAGQAMQFGYNNDYIGIVALPGDNALLCVNHEYTIPTLMFGDLAYNPNGAVEADSITARHVAVEQAAHGISVIEIARKGNAWEPIVGPRNSRWTGSTPGYVLSGPVAGHPRVRTTADPAGVSVVGTLGNCGGGTTPWQTYLSGEENINGYFGGTLAEGHAETANHVAMGVPGGRSPWAKHDPRFDVGFEPNEANRFGWVVEFDPVIAGAAPKKRTALGRFKHEGAETVLAPDGRLVVYMGDDERYQHLYRFVSRDRVDAKNRAANADLLDYGTLFVARFDDTGVDWLPLVHGQGPLTAANGFASQADVLIEARRAAKLLGATPMDRPEDVQPSPGGRVYVMLTNNSERRDDERIPANPRAGNAFGHIVELTAPSSDHAAARFAWDIVVLCGKPDEGGFDFGGARWNPATSANGWFASPDNCTIDPRGRLWIASDQGDKWGATGTADGLWALGTDGAARGTGKMFFRVPVGAEMCGPCFAADGRTFFAAVQHPGADGTANWAPFGRDSSYADPATRWPDFDDKMPPRPSVVAIRRDDGGEIGV